METNDKLYPLPGPLLQSIVRYLELRPYNEVAVLIQQIMLVVQSVEGPPLPRAHNGKAAEKQQAKDA